LRLLTCLVLVVMLPFGMLFRGACEAAETFGEWTEIFGEAYRGEISLWDSAR
jgi:hypothetical protein